MQSQQNTWVIERPRNVITFAAVKVLLFFELTKLFEEKMQFLGVFSLRDVIFA